MFNEETASLRLGREYYGRLDAEDEIRRVFDSAMLLLGALKKGEVTVDQVTLTDIGWDVSPADTAD